MIAGKEDPGHWAQRWENGKIGFHISAANPYLVQYLDLLAGGNLSGRRILVPFCGKSVDMKYLYDLGLTVVGIEFSEIGVKQFFEEQSLTYSVEDHGEYKVYKHDDKLKIFQGDLFKIDSSIIDGKCDLHWDRGALVAVEYESQGKYVDHIKTLLSPCSATLMECFEYDPSLRTGPPRNVRLENLQKCFGDEFTFKELRRDQGDDIPSLFNKFNIDEVHVVYLIQRKSGN